jgi:protein required for attachment to host cells
MAYPNKKGDFMRKVWVVVANRANASIYVSEKGTPFSLQYSLNHPESQLQERELVSDKKGKEANQTLYGTSTFEEKTSAADKEALHFAQEIASYLTENYYAQNFERLYIVAPSPFGSMLKKALPEALAKTIYSEIPKNLVHLDAKELREYLPPVL